MSNKRIDIVLIVVLIFLAIALAGGMIWGNLIYTRNSPVEKEFFVPWLSARTFLEYGDSPYSEPSYQRTQILYYGELAGENEDPLYLWTSMPGLLFYLPFALIKDYDLAMAFWTTMSEIALLVAGFLLTRLLFKKISTWLLLPIILFVVLWSFSFKDLISGSPQPFGLLALACSFLALRNQDDEIAGILLIIPFLIQGIFIGCIIFLFWWILSQRRWRILTGFGMILGLLLLLSFLLLPDWVIPTLRGIFWRMIFNPGISVHTVMGSSWPVVGPRIGWIVTILLCLLLLINWRATKRHTFDHFLWTACLTIATTPLLGLSISLENYSVLILPLLLLISIIYDRWPGKKLVNPGMIMLSLTWVAGWIAMLFFPPWTVLLFPLLISAGLLWVKWWMVKTPRTMIETWQ